MALKEEQDMSNGNRAIFPTPEKPLSVPTTIVQPSWKHTTHRQLSLHAHPRKALPPFRRAVEPLSSVTGTVRALRNPFRASGLTRATSEAGSSRPSNSHRARVTSHGTVIVSPKSISRSRYTGPPLDRSTVDNQRSEAERGYYEQEDGHGIVRRRSMIRSVSKEDYLFGRGANPRTGLITPGGGSIDSNINVMESGLPKWRQEGDQWICLDINEQIPAVTPTILPVLPIPKTRKPRLPQRLSQWNSSVPNFTPLGRRGSRSKTPVYEHSPRVLPPEPTEHIPGSFPESPTKRDAIHISQPSTSNLNIRRKPVEGLSQVDACNTNKNSTTDTPRTAAHTSDHLTNIEKRSFSAPTNRQQFSPANFGKDLPELPALASSRPGIPNRSQNIVEQPSFLGMRSQTMLNLDQHCLDSPTLGWMYINKELPCLPMNSGLSPPTQSPMKSLLYTNGTPVKSPQIIREGETRAESLERTKSLNRRSHIVEMMHVANQPSPIKNQEKKADQSICIVPNYDNPPRERMVRPQRPMITGPRMMAGPSYSKARTPVARDRIMDPFSITSMSTDTFTPMPNVRGFHQQLKARKNPGPRAMPLIPTLSTRPRMTGWQNRTAHPNMGSKDLLLDSTAPASIHTQLMPLQLRGLPVMSSVTERPENSYVICTDHRDLSNTTGMPESDQGISQTPAIPPRNKLRGLIDRNTNIGPDTLLPDFEKRLMRRCSRCENGLITETDRSTAGVMDTKQRRKQYRDSAHAPEVVSAFEIPTPITEVSEEPQTPKDLTKSPARRETVSARILDVEDDLRDHSMCCPDCCVTGCHESCLGHQNTMSSPEAKIGDVGVTLQRAPSLSTIDSTSGVSSLSSDGDEPKMKVSFIKAALKLPFWQKRPADVSSKSSGSSFSSKASQSKLRKSPKRSEPIKMVDRVRTDANAKAAARKAIESISINNITQNEENTLITGKEQIHEPSKILDKGSVGEIDSAVSIAPTIKVSVSANEGRRISGTRLGSGNQLALTLRQPQNRTVSGASTVCIQGIDKFDLANASELVLVPLEAGRMWLRNNPQVMGYGWSALDYGWSMGCVIATTGQMLLNMVYIYSKTGKVRAKSSSGERIGATTLICDTFKSILYLLVFASLLLLVGRIIQAVLLPLRLAVYIGRYILVGGQKARQ